MIEELRLPALARPATASCQPEATIKEKVLVVEDNIDMNRFVGQCLSGDYYVISAFDGQQGLEMALAFDPALIVSDIMMPWVSGVEMIAQLRKRPEMLDTPILLLSAKADEELQNPVAGGRRSGFHHETFRRRRLACTGAQSHHGSAIA